MLHRRFICPVGQGGFSIEKIEGFTVVFDCGSSTSSNMVKNCIDHLSDFLLDHVDILFISHFDMDHVNGIRSLLESTRVRRAVTPMIPRELRVAFNQYTNGAYEAIMRILTQEDLDLEVEEVGEQDGPRSYYNKGRKSIWEWTARSMMERSEFERVTEFLGTNGFDLHRLDDADYLEQEKTMVNEAFKKMFGGKGPNAKGLVVLSQKCKGVSTGICETWCGRHCCNRVIHIGDHKESSCLYVGDADLRNRQNNKRLKVFLQTHMNEKMLLLMQIPHHGSQYSIGARFEADFPARLYFLNDKDTVRLQKKTALFASLTSHGKLLLVSGVCSEGVSTETVIH